LLFSLLYGAEFLLRVDILRRCETAWWSGLRKFYGLPNGVSNVTLYLLFPRFSLVHQVTLAKYALSIRATRPLNTIFPEAAIFDRQTLFDRHRIGFAQTVKDWGLELGVPFLFRLSGTPEADAALGEQRERALVGAWETFSRMSSTCAFATLVGGGAAFRELALEASRRSRLGLRIFLLVASGSLSMSYFRSRHCPGCGDLCTFVHFVECSSLGANLKPLLSQYAAEEKWKEFIDLLLSRFMVFVHLVRGGQLSVEENDLFDALCKEDD
jgi:hypothetical protein